MEREEMQEPQEPVGYHCLHIACKCASGEEYCGQFCEAVETSSDDLKCGCGHMACDATKQMGNESSFDATGS